eukprot:CAMPEP_0174228922 /NCGR_PEP_ID=MMETSP0417-20130205/22_1 /TAXON_ID=242541 /ORGANISM="Mayorella sp, Strain BSH-02190019" /LENGTH=139 /DNA_ID=CAMNT_0015306411 /DNA_START=38 /DNA_END=457 /DNA_ORIENTATION=+
MASGIAVNEEVITTYQDLKLGKKIQYAIFRINEANTDVVVEKVQKEETSWDEFTGSLPKDDCRYAVYDFAFQVDGGQRNKLLFVVWAPDTAKIKNKMLITSTKDAVRKKLVGIGLEIQATDFSEIDIEEITQRCQSTTK